MQERDRERCRKTLAWLRRKGASGGQTDYALLDRAEEWTMVTVLFLVAVGGVRSAAVSICSLVAFLCCIYFLLRLWRAKRYLLDRREWNLAGMPGEGKGSEGNQPPASREADRETCRRVLEGQRMCRGKCSSGTDIGLLEGNPALWGCAFSGQGLRHWSSGGFGSLGMVFGFAGTALFLVIAGLASRRMLRAKRFLIAHRAWNLADVGPRPDQS